MSHAASPDLLNRLRRANGHLTSILRMIEEGDDGLKIAQQMQAVIAALEKTKTLIVTDHIEHHLEDLIGPLPGTVRDDLAKLGELAKYL
ncbi:metal-sensing transcriptional repressor [Novosphingobium profundi]|uniref:metal-sensing transcriptional repressor n=1 Tax=Novosphingobium TaxID=165696 RepID=UPI000572F6ED|nr:MULTISPECIES: metal-sensing transcriptional repressor [Novosphingobium]MBT0671631.1 metal-sensing transcriptional repressor [Novosphingobium profundi]GAM07477.1 nickel resistance protein [Novosphingobium sp. MBES04]